MRRNRFRPGDDAVSPVVGVVLLVGIAVMMTTAIGVFVLGFGPGDSPPETEISFYQESGNVTITMVRPAGVEDQNLEIRVNGNNACVDESNWSSSGSLERADSAVVYGAGGSCTGLSSGDNVRVIWYAPGGGQSDIVGEYEVP
jgi:FlaG/FlaF family flagellin (archaellin)